MIKVHPWDAEKTKKRVRSEKGREMKDTFTAMRFFDVPFKSSASS